MKIFALGCSFSSFHSGMCGFGNSWVHRLAKDNPEHHIYDASLGGAGNDHILHRLMLLEKNYGVADKIIVQLTNPNRNTTLLDKKWWKEGLNFSTKDNLTYHDDIRLHQYFVQGSFFVETVRQKKRRIKFAKHMDLAEDLLIKYFGTYLKHYDNVVKTQMAIDLINRLYGKQNVLFFTWHDFSNFSSWKYVDIPTNHIGSVQSRFNKDNKFYRLGTDTSPHYGAEGHKAVYKWLKEKIGHLILDK